MKRTIVDASQLELTENVVSIKRVTKVVKGGRNMRFTALVVVGDGNGHVGAGLGKAAEIPEAIRKGKEDAMKKLITVKLDENKSITHDISGKHTAALRTAEESSGRYRYHRRRSGPCGLRAGRNPEYPYQVSGFHQQAERSTGDHRWTASAQDLRRKCAKLRGKTRRGDSRLRRK